MAPALAGVRSADAGPPAGRLIPPRSCALLRLFSQTRRMWWSSTFKWGVQQRCAEDEISALHTVGGRAGEPPPTVSFGTTELSEVLDWPLKMARGRMILRAAEYKLQHWPRSICPHDQLETTVFPQPRPDWWMWFAGCGLICYREATLERLLRW